MKLYIKNMACTRCKLVVKSELDRSGLKNIIFKDGEVEIDDDIDPAQLARIHKLIHDLGLELIDDREAILVEKINTIIADMVFNSSENGKTTISDYISSKLGYSYKYLSNLFSAVHGNSIEKTYISHKIDRVKEILIHEEISFSEIAFRLHYSSLAHLSGQFKKETGLSLKQFKHSSPRRIKIAQIR